MRGIRKAVLAFGLVFLGALSLAAADNAIKITDFRLFYPTNDSFRIVIAATAAGETSIGSYSIRSLEQVPQGAVPAGFTLDPDGYARPVKRGIPNVGDLDNGPFDEDPRPGVYARTFSTRDWRPGFYSFQTGANNRPAAGPYIFDYRIFTFYVGQHGRIGDYWEAKAAEWARLIKSPEQAGRVKKTRNAGKTPELKVTIAEPLVVAQAPVGEKRWGYWQFPSINRTESGAIGVSFNICEDSVSAYGKGQATGFPSYFILDGGQWKLPTGKEGRGGFLLPNGDRLGHNVQPSLKVSDLKLPASVGQWTDSWGRKTTTYRVAELPPELANVRFSHYYRETGKTTIEIADVEEPLGVRASYDGLFPLLGGSWFNLKVAPDNSVMLAKANYYVYYPKESRGAEPFKHAIFLRSADNGRKWRVQGTIPYLPDRNADGMAMLRDGFTEPGLEFGKDGTMVCFLRTDDGNGMGPMYISHSLDLGKTWSSPEAFNFFGVQPELLTLKNGVMVLAYGRPGVEVRFSGDNGWTWTGPYKLVPLTASDRMADSCGYASLLATGDDRFLIAYSNFRYKGGDGVERKTILTREIIVKRR